VRSTCLLGLGLKWMVAGSLRTVERGSEDAMTKANGAENQPGGKAGKVRKRLRGRDRPQGRWICIRIQKVPEYGALDYCYPTSSTSSNDEIATRLQVLSNDTLLDSVRRFYVSVLRGQRAKPGLTKLIIEDFRQEAKQLVRVSPEDLCKTMSPHPLIA